MKTRGTEPHSNPVESRTAVHGPCGMEAVLDLSEGGV